MTFDDILAKFQEKSAAVEGFGGTVALEIADEGRLFIDASGDRLQIDTSTAQADTTLSLSMATLQALISGEINPAMAFMSGKIQVSGNIALAMKLQSLMGED